MSSPQVRLLGWCMTGASRRGRFPDLPLQLHELLARDAAEKLGGRPERVFGLDGRLPDDGGDLGVHLGRDSNVDPSAWHASREGLRTYIGSFVDSYTSSRRDFIYRYMTYQDGMWYSHHRMNNE